MDSQLQQILTVQTEQNRLLKHQLQWLKFGLLTLSALVTASLLCLGFLIHERTTAGSNVTVVTTEPILEHPISVTETDTTQIQFPLHFAESDITQVDTTSLPFHQRLMVPPMSKTAATTPIEFDFSETVNQINRPGRGCDGMCL